MSRPRPLFVALVALAAFVAACSGSATDNSVQPVSPEPSAPAISISPTTVLFAVTMGAASPGAQTVAITNTGTGSLTGLTVGTIVYGPGQPTGWLTAALSGTTAPANVVLTATTTSLPVGTYAATVPIIANETGVTNSPQSIGVTLSVNAAASSATITLSAAGQSSVSVASPNFSASLAVQSGSQYLIAVVNTDTSGSVTEGFTLSGAFSAAASAQQVASPLALPVARAPARSAIGGVPRQVAVRQLPRAALDNHTEILDENRRIYRQLGDPRRLWAAKRAQQGRSAPANAAISPAAGAVSSVYVKNTFTGGCAGVTTIGARNVATGQHVIVLADTSTASWPNAYRPDSAWYQTFANEFDQITWPHILANIGNPLALDATLSHLGKISVVITPVLNNFASATGGGTIVAFTNGCDFYPFAATGFNADFSNETEMFYSWVPSASTVTVAEWEAGLRATAPHETKHIVSYTDRIMNNSPVFEDIWLEEGLAQVSAEIWERNFNQATWKGHATFLQTVACEIDLGSNAPCDLANDKPLALMGSHLPFFFQYLESESASNAESLGFDTPANYGAGWTIARWATDQYASSGEGAFIQSLINEPALIGMANLSAHTEQPIPLLLTYWNVATAIFQTPGYTAADVRTTIPSFNFADIFSFGQTGLTCNGSPCGVFTSSGSPVYPVRPIAISTGTISNLVNAVPGTSASFFLLSATGSGTQRLQLLSGAGAALSATSGLRVAILRVQ